MKLILVYPMTTGRNFDEVLRVIDSLQLTAKHRVSTPVNWKQGDDVIIAGSVSNDEAQRDLAGRLGGAQAVHPDRRAAALNVFTGRDPQEADPARSDPRLRRGRSLKAAAVRRQAFAAATAPVRPHAADAARAACEAMFIRPSARDDAAARGNRRAPDVPRCGTIGSRRHERDSKGGTIVSRALASISVVMFLGAAALAATAQAEAPWAFAGTNVVASSPTQGGGYPVPAGRTKPDPGTCRLGAYNANRSESWIAVKPGTEDLVGTSKFFFETFSTFYMFHLGSYRVLDGAPVGNNQVQGYDCVSTGTQEMPPSWTDNTDPNVDFDTKGRAYQVTLPFNAFWEGGLHPNAEVDISLLRRHGAELDPGQRRGAARAHQQPDERHAGSRGGQAVGRGQPHPRKREPGPRVRRVGRVQRLRREGPDGGLARPRSDLREGPDDRHAVRGERWRDVRLSSGRRRG